jgi:hypothetical protein
MLTFNKLFLALAFLGGSAAAQAADGNADISRIDNGKNNEKSERTERTQGVRRSLSTGTSVGSWSHSLSQQHVDHPYCVTFENLSCTHNGVKVRQENLLGSYDVSLPLASTSKLFDASALRRSSVLAMSSSLTDGQDNWLPVQLL